MGDGEAPETYRTSTLQWRLSLVSLAALLLLATLEATDGGPILELSLANAVLTGAILLAAAGWGFQATVRVSEAEIRKGRPLRADNVLRFEDVRKLNLPAHTEALWLYTGPSRSPALGVEAQSFERFEALARQVLRRLPRGAEIQDPAGRVKEYRRGGDAEGEGE